MKFKELIPFIKVHQKEIKVHCAIGIKNVYDPLNAFMLGRFKEWQEHQSKRNFSRKYILSLIYSGKDEWLFAGLYESLSVKEESAPGKGYIYKTCLTEIGGEFIGKAVIGFKKDFRQSYPCLENYLESFELIELYREQRKIVFPGYDKVNISWKELSQLIDTDSWKTALENQKGVYLITDIHNGKRYVGAAYGTDMILGRWNSYIKTGHGGNAELKLLTFDYIKENFMYSILEVFKPTTDDNLILEREAWWKDVLLTRNKKFGYNSN